MENSLLYSHISNGTWLDIKCCYCDTEQSIYLTYSKRHGTERDYKLKSRLKIVTEFIKDHLVKTPDCAKIRENTHIDKPFQMIDEHRNKYAFHPEDKEFKAQLKYTRSWLKYLSEK